ncbi:MAG TPA: hypothetical protein VH301_02410 [Usitatibacter sp.]|nr:hypothetical protein [Usitatibacter sp.]
MSPFVTLRRAFALALLLAQPAWAASDPEIDKIREEIRQMKSSYEARIQSLEQRLKDAEDKAAAAQAAPLPPPPSPAPSAPASSIAAFNPAISVVLQGSYANLSLDPDKYALSGFLPAAEAGAPRRGFSLGESELAIYANVDDKFSGNLIASLTPDDRVSVEEAYGIWMTAPYGLVPKFGRFFSGLGYLNEQHQHAWDFFDAPLAYQAFLGGQYANDGVQVKWVAPMDQFVELGVEAGSGESFPGTSVNRNGAGSFTVFAHTGGDVGESHSWRAGVSYLRTHADGREGTLPGVAANDADLAFSGRSDVAVADFTWKWAPNGNAHDTNFKVQGEYLWRKERGDLTYDASNAMGLQSTSAYSSRQGGWYLQGVYQWMPLWRVGARYDQLDPGGVDYAANAPYFNATDFNPKRYTMMVDYTPSEFSRWRLQLARAEVRPGFNDNELFVQYILSLGAHGAHKY